MRGEQAASAGDGFYVPDAGCVPLPRDLVATRSASRQATRSAPVTQIRCFAPPTIDGGTSFVLRTRPSDWSPEVRQLAERVWTPEGRGPSFPKNLSVLGPDGMDVRFGVIAEARRLVLTAEGRAAIAWSRDRVTVTAVAEELWTAGFAAWAMVWLNCATFLATGGGRTLLGLDEAAQLGWSTKNVEIAADFGGLVLTERDPKLFVGVRPGKSRTISSRTDAAGFAPNGRVDAIDTFETSSRRLPNGTAMNTHLKTALLKKRRSLESSAYAATWKANGWNGEEVRRVEARASGAALKLGTADGEVLDLQDPAALSDGSKLRAFFGHVVGRFRLIEARRDGGVPARRATAPTDPRGVAVQAAAGDAGAATFVRLDEPGVRTFVARDVAANVTIVLRRALDRLRRAGVPVAGVLRPLLAESERP